MPDTERGQVAATAAQIYEEFFLPALFDQWPPHLLAAANVAAGEDLLDVGCGTGVAARAAVRRVGSSARVVGVDLNPGMLAVAEQTAGVEWLTGSAEALPVDSETFDVVICQFAMMFFNDRRAAMSEMHRALRSDGRVAVATWSSLEQTPGYAAMVDLLDRLFGRDAGDALRSPYNMGDPTELEELLAAEFDHVEVTMVPGTARFASIEAWVHTDVRGWTLSDMSDAEYERLLEAAQTELAGFTAADGTVTFDAPALIGVGVKR